VPLQWQRRHAVGSAAETISGNGYVPKQPYIVNGFSGTFSNGPVWAQTSRRRSMCRSRLHSQAAPTCAGLVLQAKAYFTMTGNQASPTALYGRDSWLRPWPLHRH